MQLFNRFKTNNLPVSGVKTAQSEETGDAMNAVPLPTPSNLNKPQAANMKIRQNTWPIDVNFVS